MAFLTFSVIAEHCDDLFEKYMAAAASACGIAIHSIWIVPASLPLAIAAGLGCLTALGAWAAAIWWYNRKLEAFQRAHNKYWECLDSHQNDTGNGNA